MSTTHALPPTAVPPQSIEAEEAAHAVEQALAEDENEAETDLDEVKAAELSADEPDARA